MSRRAKDEIIVIMWRDIPAQINGKVGDHKHGVMLPHRFQKAIDRAAMVAGKKTAQEYVGEWRRTSYPVAGALVETVENIAATIEEEFTNERLHTLVDNGGWDPLSPERHPETTPHSDTTHSDTTHSDTTQETP
jgi:hypothetical protein